VSGEKLRRGPRTENATHIQYHPAVTLRTKLPHGGAVREDHAFEVQRERPVDALVSNVMQRPVAEFSPTATSDVVEGIQPAELLNRLDHCTLGGLSMGGVTNKEPPQIP
jgi:hypothetical protein